MITIQKYQPGVSAKNIYLGRTGFAMYLSSAPDILTWLWTCNGHYVVSE